MSQEVAIFAIIEPTPGKLERVKEVIKNAVDWVQANEPDTLQYSLYEEEAEDGSVKLAMFENYASAAAQKAHEQTDNFAKMFKIFEDEQLLKGAPTLVKGKQVQSFIR